MKRKIHHTPSCLLLAGAMTLGLAGDLNGQTPSEAYNFVGNPFVQPNDTTLNWYGSGDITNNGNKKNVPNLYDAINQEDVDRLDSLIAGTFSDPSDRRLMDRADVDGNEIFDFLDRNLLQSYVNGTTSYLPGHWNFLPTVPERSDWVDKMFAVDKTDTVTAGSIDPVTGQIRDCKYFETRTTRVFNNLSQEDKDILDELYSYNEEDDNRFNLPLESATIVTYNVNPDLNHAHKGNIIAIGNDATNWTHLKGKEPQNDSDYVLGGNLRGDTINFGIKGFPIVGVANGGKGIIAPVYVQYNMLGTNPGEGIVNPNESGLHNLGVYLKVISKRDNTNPDVNIGGEYYNPNLNVSISDETIVDRFNWINPVYNEDGYLVSNDGKEYYNPSISGTLNDVPIEGEIFKETNRPFEENLSDGVYNLKVNAVDGFGNRSSAIKTFERDKTPVEILAPSPAQDSSYAQGDNVDLECILRDKNLALENCHYKLNDSQEVYFTDSVSTIPLNSDSKIGENKLEIIAEDKAGNVSSKTINYNYGITGLEDEVLEKDKMKVYPNPAQDMVYFEYQNLNRGIVKLSIHDLSGRKMAEIVDGDGDGKTNLVVSEFGKGMYFYRLKSEVGSTYSGKLIKK